MNFSLPTEVVRQLSVALHRLCHLDGGQQADLVARETRLNEIDPAKFPHNSAPCLVLQGLVDGLGHLSPETRVRLVPCEVLNGPQGLALLLTQDLEKGVLLPSQFYSPAGFYVEFDPSVCALRVLLGARSVGMDILTHFPPSQQGAGGVYDAVDPHVERFAEILAEQAPPGSAYRRHLITRLRYFFADGFTWRGLVDLFSQLFEDFVDPRFLDRFAVTDNRHHERLHTFQFINQRLMKLLVELHKEKLIWNSLQKRYPLLPFHMLRLPADLEKLALHPPKEPSVEAMIEGLSSLLPTPHPDEIGSPVGCIQQLRSLLAEAIRGSLDWRALRVAIVGYGISLDIIDFFLQFGLEVIGVEKHGDGSGLLERYQLPLPDADGLTIALGIPEVTASWPSWPQLSPFEVREALGFPTGLSLYDALDPNLPTKGCDLVFALGLVDAAIPTVASLVRPGGLMIAQVVLYEGSRQATTASGFKEAGGEAFEQLMSARVTGCQTLLPSRYHGDRAVYVLRRV